MKNQSSQLKDLITVKRGNGTFDDDGNQNFANFFTTFAEILETGGDEKYSSDIATRAAKNFATFKIRKSALSMSVCGDDRILARGRLWRVASLPREVESGFAEIDAEVVK